MSVVVFQKSRFRVPTSEQARCATCSWIVSRHPQPGGDEPISARNSSRPVWVGPDDRVAGSDRAVSADSEWLGLRSRVEAQCVRSEVPEAFACCRCRRMGDICNTGGFLPGDGDAELAGMRAAEE